MPKTYSAASEDVEQRIARLRAQYHQHLEGVTIQALFVYGDDSDPVLKHQGYPAAAVTKIVGTKERAAGLADALIVIDRYTYAGLPGPTKDALLDHELYHLARPLDDRERPKYDVLGRPKLEMRMHDQQLGWFDEIAARHGEHSFEVMQAKELIEGSRQLYFDFMLHAEAEPEAEAA